MTVDVRNCPAANVVEVPQVVDRGQQHNVADVLVLLK